MNKYFKILIIIISTTILFLIVLFFLEISNIILPWEHNEVRQTVQIWGGLAKFPKNAEHFQYRKEGSMFTREFTVEFDAPENEIKDWVKKSKGLQQKFPETKGDLKVYEVRGYENSMGGTVVIEKKHIKINMMWS